MKILPINNFNYQHRNYNSNPQKLVKSNKSISTQNNVSFKSISILTPFYLGVWKTLTSLLKEQANSNKILRLKQTLDAVIKNPNRQIADTQGTLFILGKTSSNLDRYCYHEDIDSIKIMKQNVLKDIFPSINDTTEVNRTIKKQYLTDLVASGDNDSFEFIDAFQNLSDYYYKPYKEELLNTILYSQASINQQKINPDLMFFNSKLLSDLDKTEYDEYLTNNRVEIFKLDVACYDKTKKDFLGQRKNNAFFEYIYDFSIGEYQSPLDILQKPIKQDLFKRAIENANGDYKALAEIANISDDFAMQIIQDRAVIEETKNLPLDEKAEILSWQFVYKTVPILFFDLHKRENPDYSELFLAESIKQNFLHFIKQTTCQEELLKKAHDKLQKADALIAKHNIKPSHYDSDDTGMLYDVHRIW